MKFEFQDKCNIEISVGLQSKRAYADSVPMRIEGRYGVEQIGTVFDVTNKVYPAILRSSKIWIFSIDGSISAVQVNVGIIREGNTGKIDCHCRHNDFSSFNGQLFGIDLSGSQNVNEVSSI